MGLLDKIQSWASSHNPKWLALIRVGLGVALLMSGVTFMNDQVHFEEKINASSLKEYTSMITLIVPWVHVVGGFMIMTGIFTRFAAIVQIPIMIGAIFFVNLSGLNMSSQLGFSIMVLALLVVFVIEGSGPLSLANYFKEVEEEEKEEEETATV
jgi:putative oxidoreductase